MAWEIAGISGADSITLKPAIVDQRINSEHMQTAEHIIPVSVRCEHSIPHLSPTRESMPGSDEPTPPPGQFLSTSEKRFPIIRQRRGYAQRWARDRSAVARGRELWRDLGPWRNVTGPPMTFVRLRDQKDRLRRMNDVSRLFYLCCSSMPRELRGPLPSIFVTWATPAPWAAS